MVDNADVVRTLGRVTDLLEIGGEKSRARRAHVPLGAEREAG